MPRGFSKNFKVWGILYLYVENLTRRVLIRPKNRGDNAFLLSLNKYIKFVEIISKDLYNYFFGIKDARTLNL